MNIVMKSFMGSEKREMTSREKIEKIRDILKNVDVYDKDEIKEVIDHVELCEIYEDMTTINTYLTEILEIIKEDPVAAADGSEISDEEAIEYLQILEKRMFNISGTVWCGDIPIGVIEKAVNAIEAKTGYCKDCKWWKDSDGLYRRGSHAESQCPINRREVFEGNGYCYMFAPPQESEGKEDV